MNYTRGTMTNIKFDEIRAQLLQFWEEWSLSISFSTFISFRYVSIGEQANKPSQTTSALANQTLTTSNMFSILNDAINESKKKKGVPRIGVSTTSDKELNVSRSMPKDTSKGTKIEPLSKKSLSFSPDLYGYDDSGYEPLNEII